MDTDPDRQVVAALVAGYVPRGVPESIWMSIAAGVREAVVAATTSVATARVALASLARFGAWLHTEGYAVDVMTLTNPDFVERFTQVGMPGASEATRATCRATLRRIAYRLRPAVSAPTERIAYRRAKAPYARFEVSRFFALAGAQPTAARRRSFTAILALGLGCGLTGADMAWVRGSDITESGVRVSEGLRPRTVPPLLAYADLLCELAHEAGHGLLIGSGRPGTGNVTAATLARMTGDRSLDRVLPSRLRSTWLVTHLRLRTPLQVLLPAAGLESSRTLDDLLSWAAPITADERGALLAGPPTQRAAWVAGLSA